MGGATVEGLVNTGLYKSEDICVSDPSQAVLDKFVKMGVSVTTDNAAAAAVADVVMVCVKPWLVKPVLQGIQAALDPQRQLLVVIAAGVKSADVQQLLGSQCPPLFLCIPNIAIAQLQSMTFLVPCTAAYAPSAPASPPPSAPPPPPPPPPPAPASAPVSAPASAPVSAPAPAPVSRAAVSPQQTATVKTIFDAMGQTLITDEQHLPSGTTLASCGIAYAMRYIRAAAEGGVELGFRADDAKRIVMQTIKGAVAVLEASGLHPEAAIDLVTTPGGVTIRGLNEMEHAGFTSAVIRGLKAGC